jgi:uncharacterized metal-binding protein
MKYEHHIIFNIFLAFLFSVLCFSKHVQFFEISLFWAGVLPYSMVITPDLDSLKSKVTQLWNFVGLGFAWSPFCGYGHREVLHHITWGPFIQVAPVWIIVEAADVKLGMWFFIGAVFALEGHIWSDKVYSKVMKYKIVRKIASAVRKHGKVTT